MMMMMTVYETLRNVFMLEKKKKCHLLSVHLKKKRRREKTSKERIRQEEKGREAKTKNKTKIV
jgi:hypothetical protein